MKSPVLDVQSITKRYRHIRAVDGLSLKVMPGEFVGFIGPNGAGKTTTMRCIAGQLLPEEGNIQIAGADVNAAPIEARKQMGYVPQELDLYQYLTGEEFLRLVADVRGVEPAVQDARVEELLGLTELLGARHRILREYSGGMARKIAIAAALIGQPPLLLLDESFVGLDPESTMALRRYLVSYCENGGAVILSSHILDMLERICTRVVILVQGQVRLDMDREALDAALTEDCPTLNDLYMATAHPEAAAS